MHIVFLLFIQGKKAIITTQENAKWRLGIMKKEYKKTEKVYSMRKPIISEVQF